VDPLRQNHISEYNSQLSHEGTGEKFIKNNDNYNNNNDNFQVTNFLVTKISLLLMIKGNKHIFNNSNNNNNTLFFYK